MAVFDEIPHKFSSLFPRAFWDWLIKFRLAADNQVALMLIHAANASAHSATGDIVGDEDWATLATGGVVKLASAVTDASASTVSGSTSTVAVTSSNVSTAPASYSQAWGQEVEALANECKSDINSLVADVNTLAGDLDSAITDLNSTITKLNSLLASKRTAKQLEP